MKEKKKTENELILGLIKQGRNYDEAKAEASVLQTIGQHSLNPNATSFYPTKEHDFIYNRTRREQKKQHQKRIRALQDQDMILDPSVKVKTYVEPREESVESRRYPQRYYTDIGC